MNFEPREIGTHRVHVAFNSMPVPGEDLRLLINIAPSNFLFLIILIEPNDAALTKKGSRNKSVLAKYICLKTVAYSVFALR